MILKIKLSKCEFAFSPSLKLRAAAFRTRRSLSLSFESSSSWLIFSLLKSNLMRAILSSNSLENALAPVFAVRSSTRSSARLSSYFLLSMLRSKKYLCASQCSQKLSCFCLGKALNSSIKNSSFSSILV